MEPLRVLLLCCIVQGVMCCLEGQYASGNGNCISCSPTCKACDGMATIMTTSCTQCNDSHVLFRGNCVSCSEGQYVANNGTCAPCSDNCKECDTTSKHCTQCRDSDVLFDGRCVSCSDGQFVDTTGKCKLCPQHCKVCDSKSANCTHCYPGFNLTGGTCQINKNCSEMIPNCSKCNITTDSTYCVECKLRFHLVNNECKPEHDCSPQCKYQKCDDNGTCTSGCVSSDRYGSKCEKICSKSFPNCYTCNITATPVHCVQCITGYHLLDSTCIPNIACTACKGEACDTDGTCTHGCSSSDRYGPLCDKSCSGTFSHCAECNTTVMPVTCMACVTGYVLRAGVCAACTSRDTYVSCNNGGRTVEAVQREVDNKTAIFTGASIGGFAVVVIVAVVLLILIERGPKGRSVKKPEPQIPIFDITKAKQDHGMDPALRSTDPSVHGSTNSVGGSDTNTEETDTSSDLIPAIDLDYTTDTTGLIGSRVPVAKLLAYVRSRTREDFAEEFQKLPSGLTKSFSTAMQNKACNRYKKIYPYDESRVVLNDDTCDYINASHIDCYSQYNSYIASLGPTSKTMPGFVPFWTMVWQEKVEVVVMLTNLTEGATMKCEQYWPGAGATKTYGDVTVTCHSEDVYAEYTVRSFTVQNSETRTLHHVQYTAWPDKSVPDDVTSLIEFRQKVIDYPRMLAGPTLVHCSAGVGRTGTYIALDILTREGHATGSVDVYDCVETLRSQRVIMVQKAEQYEYLHNALVHSLTFDCDPINADTVRDLLQPNNAKALYAQFEHLIRTSDIISDEERRDVAENMAQRHKNRPGADIPGNRYRPWLHMWRSPMQSDYINAVFLNSFQQRDQYIVAQTPLPTTVADFLTLVMQTNCPCIVSLDDDTTRDKTVAVYLPPTNEALEYGLFQVECVTCETTPLYTLRQLVITAEGSQGQTMRTVYHFQCTVWEKGDNMPKDPAAFLQLIRNVEMVSLDSETEGPTIIHCLNGATRSALFCVVSILIQKMEIEHQVSVVNTVRQVKARRRRAIPDKEQYEFCHQCLASYIRSFDTYSNFSRDSGVGSAAGSGRVSAAGSGIELSTNSDRSSNQDIAIDLGIEKDIKQDTAIEIDLGVALDIDKESIAENAQEKVPERQNESPHCIVEALHQAVVRSSAPEIAQESSPESEQGPSSDIRQDDASEIGGPENNPSYVTKNEQKSTYGHGNGPEIGAPKNNPSYVTENEQKSTHESTQGRGQKILHENSPNTTQTLDQSNSPLYDSDIGNKYEQKSDDEYVPGSDKEHYEANIVETSVILDLGNSEGSGLENDQRSSPDNDMGYKNLDNSDGSNLGNSETLHSGRVGIGDGTGSDLENSQGYDRQISEGYFSQNSENSDPENGLGSIPKNDQKYANVNELELVQKYDNQDINVDSDSESSLDAALEGALELGEMYAQGCGEDIDTENVDKIIVMPANKEHRDGGGSVNVDLLETGETVV